VAGSPAHTTDREAFVDRYGGVFEHSPWVAEAAWDARPFADAHDLHVKLVAAMRAAPRERKVQLIRAHPDLAGRAAVAGTLTSDSAREQAAAGLDRLTRPQYDELTRLNAAYRERFGFPFVICAREHDAASIIVAAAERLQNEPPVEEDAALREIEKIARLRLEQLP
jgi:OHCU decarboxylase